MVVVVDDETEETTDGVLELSGALNLEPEAGVRPTVFGIPTFDAIPDTLVVVAAVTVAVAGQSNLGFRLAGICAVVFVFATTFEAIVDGIKFFLIAADGLAWLKELEFAIAKLESLDDGAAGVCAGALRTRLRAIPLGGGGKLLLILSPGWFVVKTSSFSPHI